jgi:CHAD domain-containing protein
MLEFEVEPASMAPRVFRHPAVAVARQGRRPRVASDEAIWLDDAAGSLAEAGLALERPRRGGPDRLWRVGPGRGGGGGGGGGGGAPWVPGTPPQALDGDDAAAAVVGRAGLVPVSAFSFRRSALSLSTEAGPVEAELLAGTLRAVAAERPAARLRLAGERDAVLGLATRLAADLPLLPPRAALAEEGRALALGGGAPRPRHRGAPDLAGAATVEDALLRAVGHLLDVMVHQAPACRLGAGPEGVHQLRVALRRLRSVLKAFRGAARAPALDALDEGLKALARRLGPARDWDVFLSGLAAEAAAALGEDRRLAGLARAAEAKRDAAYHALRRELDGPGFRRLVLDGAALLLRRPWRDGAGEDGAAAALDAPLAEFAAALLQKRWRKLRGGGEGIAEHSLEALHELRLEAKRLRYAAELFAPLWGGKAARRFLKRLSALQEALGTVNDAAVARGLLAALDSGAPAWAAGAVEGFAAARVGPARESALSRWDDLAAAKAFWGGAPGGGGG